MARVYSYVLGGRDNYGVDKDLGDYFTQDLPGSEQLAITNREAILRAARDLATGGIRQVIDMGCGLPASKNVHEVIRAQHPDARIVYVDNDPFVVAHGKALMVPDANVAVIEADVRDPAAISEHPEVKQLIDFDEPVGILFGITLSFLNDDEDPSGVVKYWTNLMPANSKVYISSFRTGRTREAAATSQKILEAFGRGRFRTDDEILSCFGDLELLDNRLLPCAQWHWDDELDGPRDHGRTLSVWEELVVSGLARKS